MLARLVGGCPPQEPADTPWVPLTCVGLEPASLEVAGAQVDALVERLTPNAGDRLLDMGCGVGRHLVWFLRRGLEVTGVDSSPGLCRLATYLTGGEAAIRCDDFLGDSTDGVFDLVMLMSETFGIGDAQERDVQVLARCAHSLTPEGHLVLQVADAERRAAEGPQRHEWVPAGSSCRAVEEVRTERSVSIRSFTLTFGDVTLTYQLEQRLYSATALRELAESVGLSLLSFENVGNDLRPAPEGEDVLAIMGLRP